MSLSTHVLDTAAGRPAAGLPVRLERRAADGGWQAVCDARTDADGRVRVPAAGDLGVYRWTFVIAGSFFPEITVTFEVTDAARHYHVPLLLSPFGYTTYRGS
jgi:5-hydroxyisourate hydrolase